MDSTDHHVMSTASVLHGNTNSPRGKNSTGSYPWNGRGAHVQTFFSCSESSVSNFRSRRGRGRGKSAIQIYPVTSHQNEAVGFQNLKTEQNTARTSASTITYAAVAASKPPKQILSSSNTKLEAQHADKPIKLTNAIENRRGHTQSKPKTSNLRFANKHSQSGEQDSALSNAGVNSSFEPTTQSPPTTSTGTLVTPGSSDIHEKSWQKQRSKSRKKTPGIIELDYPECIHTSTPVKKRKRSRRRASSVSALDSSVTLSPISPAVRRYNAPIEISLSQLLITEPQVSREKTAPTSHKVSVQKTKLQSVNENARIGKVREVPKAKRPTTLKRALLAERELRKARRCTSAPATPRTSHAPSMTKVDDKENSSSTTNQDVPAKLQTEAKVQRPEVPSALKRDNKQQDDLVTELMQRLSQLQDRAYVKFVDAPHHRKRTRRFVCGLREVIKHLRLKHTRLILIARDLEGGATRYCRKLQETAVAATDDGDQLSALEQILDQIWHLATSDTEKITPILLAHTRRSLAYLAHKPGRVSVIGILSDAGAESTMKSLLALQTSINLPQPMPVPSSHQPELQTQNGKGENPNPSDLQIAFASMSIGT